MTINFKIFCFIFKFLTWNCLLLYGFALSIVGEVLCFKEITRRIKASRFRCLLMMMMEGFNMSRPRRHCHHFPTLRSSLFEWKMYRFIILIWWMSYIEMTNSSSFLLSHSRRKVDSALSHSWVDTFSYSHPSQCRLLRATMIYMISTMLIRRKIFGFRDPFNIVSSESRAVHRSSEFFGLSGERWRNFKSARSRRNGEIPHSSLPSRLYSRALQWPRCSWRMERGKERVLCVGTFLAWITSTKDSSPSTLCSRFFNSSFLSLLSQPPTHFCVRPNYPPLHSDISVVENGYVANDEREN